MTIASAITFDTAEHEYNQAWNATRSTRFELAPVDVNTVLKKRYRVSPERTLTRAMIWDMETKKAWDPLSYIPYVVSQARSWGPNDPARRLYSVQPVVVATRMDHVGRRSRSRGRFR